MDNKNLTKRNIFIVVVFAVLMIGGLLYFFGSSDASPAKEIDLLLVPKLEVLSEHTASEGQLVYQNELFGFSFIYPEVMTLREVEEGAGAWTYTFQNPESGEGFQMFIVPYEEGAISNERFLRDVPSGVRENVEDVEVDGIAAVAFDSEDALLGATKEVWFIHKGFLYEITSPKKQERMLSDILLTFTFND